MNVEGIPVPGDAVREIEALYRRGLYLQAFRRAQQVGPLRQWTGGEGRALAARLAFQLGAPRLSLWHRLKAWREHPNEPVVQYYYGWTILEYAGPYDAWLFLKQQGDMPNGSADVRSAWYALRAEVAGALRDFERADAWLDRALEVYPDSPWVHVTRSSVLGREDRYEEALAAADHALGLQPWFRPAVQARAHLLTLLERDGEAFDFLKEAAQQIECASLYWQLGAIHFEREEYDLARKSLDQFEKMSPLLERTFGQSFCSLRSFLAYLAGDDEAAIAWARKSGEKDEQIVIQRLQDPARRDRPRITLPVGFTRQHHVTCVPATLATISRFWSMPAEHLQVAEEICYNGTSAFAERRWATDHGWFVREFTVTEQATEQLIAAGIPFTLTTIDPGNAHLQAVVGYDGRRGSLIIRDPYLRNRREVLADKFLEHYRAFGPRGMALVPEAESRRLAGLSLPDAELWDEIHCLDTALEQHDRDRALAIVEQLRQRAPDHFLTLHALRRLAIYDANPHDELAAVERLQEQFPDNPVLQLSRLALLRHLDRREPRLQTLEELNQKPDADSAFLLAHAQELAQDAREHDRAIALLRKAIRKRVHDAGPYYVLGNVLWDQLRFEEGLELYRFAACLSDRDEQLAEAYFRAAEHCRDTETAIDWLRRRFERFGAKSRLPAQTLVWALGSLERTGEALQVLDEAVRLRPDDGELQLYAAATYATASSEHLPRAKRLLEEARDHCPRAQWLRISAEIAWYQGQLTEALSLFQQVLQLQPLAVSTHRSVAQLLAETQSRQAALNHLRTVVERFPHHQPLLQLWIEWLRDEPPEEIEPVVERLIELNPANAWAVRELGFLLAEQGRLDEAEQCAEKAARLDPTHPARHHLQGKIFEARGQLAKARAEYREAIRLSVDNEYAMARLLNCCDTAAERREELQFVHQELVRQVVYGDGLLAYRSFAHTVLDPEELLTSLQEALRARPDLWHAWSACVHQLIAMERLDDAERLARRATERFPLLPRIWLDLSEVCRARNDLDGELAALRTAHRINPSWSEATRRLAELHQRRGELDRARTLLESAVSREPLDAVNRGFLADVLWELGDKEAALEQIEQAVNLGPGYEWAWDQLCNWAAEAGQPDRPEQAARQLVDRKPGEARSWLILAQVLDGGEHLEECLAALRKAAELNPRLIDAYEEQARLLTLEGRFEEALAACRPTHVWPEQLPAELIARAAWIEWSRGNHQQAVTQMRHALEVDPAMPPSWQILADWYLELEDYEGYLEATRQLVRLNPYRETSLGYYAEALLKTGNRQAAKETFRRAFEIQPHYVFAGIWLFDLQLEDDQLDEAAETLEQLLANDDGPFVLARAVQLAAKRGDSNSATDTFRRLCLTPAENEWPLHAAFEALCEAHWGDAAQEILESTVDDENADPEVGRLWAAQQAKRGRRLGRERFLTLMEKGHIGEMAVYGWVEGLLKAKKAAQLRKFLGENADWLRTNTFTWGTVAMAWTALRDWSAALAWTKNWRDYPEAKPWMLVNVAEALRAACNDEEAAEVSRLALEMPSGHGQHLHRLWLACDHVMAGEFSEAAALLESVDPQTLDEDYAFLYMLVEADVQIVRVDPAQRRATFQLLRRKIDRKTFDYKELLQEPARKRFYRFSVKHIARHVGTFLAKLWAWWRCFLW